MWPAPAVAASRRLVERQRLERRRAVEPRGGFVPADHQLGRRGDVVALADRLVVAGVDLLRQLLPLRAHVVGLRHEDGGPAAATTGSRTRSPIDRVCR